MMPFDPRSCEIAEATPRHRDVRLLAMLASLLLLLLASSESHAQQQVYWREWQQGLTRMNYDGTSEQSVIGGFSSSIFALDPQAGILYYGVLQSGVTVLFSVDVYSGGSPTPTFVTTIGGDGQYITNLDLDVENQVLYASSFVANKAWAVDLATPSPSTIVGDPFIGPTSNIAVDPGGGHIYYSGSGGAIRRANLDGSDNQLAYGISGPVVSEIAVDPERGYLYAIGGSTASTHVRRYDLATGANGTTLWSTPFHTGDANIAIDPSSNTLLWTRGNETTRPLYRMDLETMVVSSAPMTGGGNSDFALDSRPDCNGNGVLDSQDIALGASEDCNENLVPDECEIVGWEGPDQGDYTTPAHWSSGQVPTNGIVRMVREGAASNTAVLGEALAEIACTLDIEGDPVGGGVQSLYLDEDSLLESKHTVVGDAGALELNESTFGNTVADPVTADLGIALGGTLRGAGEIRAHVANEGRIEANSPIALRFSGELVNESTGLITTSTVAGATLDARNGSVLDNQGALVIDSGTLLADELANSGLLGMTARIGGASTSTLNATGPITNSGEICFDASGSPAFTASVFGGSFTSSGQVVVGGNTIVATALFALLAALDFTAPCSQTPLPLLSMGGFGEGSSAWTLAIFGDFYAGSAATMNVGDGTILFGGDFVVDIDDGARFDMRDATLRAAGQGIGVTQELRLPAADLGAQVDLDAAEVYAIGTLHVGPTPTTVIVPESTIVYARNVIVDPGATLQIEGGPVYYQTASVSGSVTGDLVEVTPPVVTALSVLGRVAMALLLACTGISAFPHGSARAAAHERRRAGPAGG